MSERDEGLSARDAEMLDSLYRAAPGSIDGDAELEQLQQLRSVFAELKAHQDEPPPAGMALLMAAARQAAEERRPVGLWTKLRAGWSSMLAHPAMSAVAAAVVVVGVGGYLVARGVRPAAEQAPTVSSAAEPAAAPMTAPATIATGEVDAESASAASQDMPTAEPMMEEASRLEREREFKGAAGRKEVQERGQPRPAPVTTKDARGPDLAIKKRADAPRDEAEQEETSAPKLQEQWTTVPEAPPAPEPAEAAPINAKPAPTKAAPPSPGARDKTASDATSAKGAGRGVAPSAGLAQADGDDSAGADAPSRSQRWYEQAKAAATRGDCEAVSLFGARIKSEDPAFYEARFRKDATIAKCLPRGSEKR